MLYIVVGGEGATNFPRDELHIGFKALMVEKGFQPVHVEKANYLNWEKARVQRPCSSLKRRLKALGSSSKDDLFMSFLHFF